MVHVMLPSMLAIQAGGQRRFDIDAATLGEALRALPVADLLFDVDGVSNPWLLIYLNDTNAAETGGLTSRVAASDEVRVIAVLAGG